MLPPDREIRELQILNAIRRIVHAVERQSKRVERATGITLPQLVVMTAIRALGDVTSSRLSVAANLSPATVTTILDKLEANALVARTRSSGDRRVVHARLTPRGERALTDAAPWLHARFVSAFAALDAPRREALLDALETVAELMGAAEAGDPAPEAAISATPAP